MRSALSVKTAKIARLAASNQDTVHAGMGLFSRTTRPTLDAVRFDNSGYRSLGEPRPGMRAWHTPQGDGVGLYLYTLPPDLPRVTSIAALRSYYERQIASMDGRLVSVSLPVAAGMPVVQVLSTTPQQPAGLTYVGAITLAFRDFSFVLKIQAEDRGPTGMREAIVIDQRLAAGDTIEAARAFDTDASELDDNFPAHQVSRARSVLAHVCRTLQLDRSISAAPRFPLPA